ncbi:hypothetical protein JCM14713_25430 [Desulfomicrobium salsuginis]
MDDMDVMDEMDVMDLMAAQDLSAELAITKLSPGSVHTVHHVHLVHGPAASPLTAPCSRTSGKAPGPRR